MFNFSVGFHFTLRGVPVNGVWKVAITDDEGTTTTALSATKEDFFTSSRRITIECQSEGRGVEVNFESSKTTVIRLASKWDEWNCDDFKNANTRCDIVRQGNFWGDGAYDITFLGIRFHRDT